MVVNLLFNHHSWSISSTGEIVFYFYYWPSGYQKTILKKVKGIDYNKNFASVAKLTIVHYFLIVAASKHRSLHQMNVNNDFLYGDLFVSACAGSVCLPGYTGQKWPSTSLLLFVGRSAWIDFVDWSYHPIWIKWKWIKNLLP